MFSTPPPGIFENDIVSLEGEWIKRLAISFSKAPGGGVENIATENLIGSG